MPSRWTTSLRPRVLFVCAENACRSQIAEALLRRCGEGRIEASSAGSRPAGRIHPGAVAVLREIGIDPAGQQSKSLADVPDAEFDVVITLGWGEAPPPVPAKRHLDWGIPDPRHMNADELRLVRDHLAARVEMLVEELERDRRREADAARGTSGRPACLPQPALP
jgi:protein-tyrosine-phosphatase